MAYPADNFPMIGHDYAQVGGVRLHYAECGVGETLVLLLHGFPECWYSWRHQLAALGGKYHVVAPDLRGYNLSDKPPNVSDYRMDHLVDDVLGLIRYFGKRNAAVIGHDWGAAVAWATAVRNPEYVWKVAALQVPPAAIWIRNLTFKQALRSWYMFFFLLPRLPEWMISRGDFASLTRTFEATAVRGNAFTDTDLAVYKAALREPGSLTSAINYYRANVPSLFLRRKENTESNSGRIGVPSLFIYGERDFAIAPETVQGVSSVVDGPYREIRIARSGHWVQQEASAEVNVALMDFLDADDMAL